MVKPRPTAAPFTAASRGLGNSWSVSTKAGKPERSGARRAGVDRLGHLEQVGSGAERLAGTGEHDRADGVVGGRGAQGVGRRVIQLLVERVRRGRAD